MTEHTIPRGFAALLALSLVLGGCGLFQPAPVADESPDEPVVVTDEETREPRDVEVGEGSRTVRLTNETGCSITAISLKDQAAEGSDPAVAFDGLDVAAGDTIVLSFDPVEGAERYEVRLTTGEERVIVLRSVDLAGLDELDLRYEDSIGYVSYVDEETQQEVDDHAEAVAAQEAEDAGMVTYDMESQLDDSE